MNPNICNNCGGNYEYRNGRWICRSCGSYKPEEISNEEVTLLYTAFQKLRLADFCEAESEFDDIIQKYPQNPNAYWGRLMSKYGIKYERDFDGRMIPTCYATSIESIMSASDYRNALKYADAENKAYYQAQAEYIERVRCEWIEKASKEKPYDVFICYKDSDLANGIDRTKDRIAAQDIYTYLTDLGYHVFYSHVSLQDKVGEKYEPYIFNALSTAKVMLVYGSRAEYITSTWLKNEWTRYEKRIQAGEKNPNSLLVACDGFSPSELPLTLSSKQCFDAKEKTFFVNLEKAVRHLIHGEDEAIHTTNPSIHEKKAKRKTPIFVTLFLLLLAIGGLLTWSFLNSSVTTINNPSQNATVVSTTGSFPKGTELYIKEIVGDSKLESMAAALSINQENYHLYDMELQYKGNVLDVDGSITVTLPLPAEISAENATVYYMSGTSPKLISCQVSDNKISFVTNHFSVYMIAETVSICNHIPVIDHAVTATCTKDGLTEGKHCSTCHEILLEQAIVPAAHKPGPEADCMNSQHCTVCRIELKEALGHTPGKSATCTSAQTCTVCRTELAPAKGHIPGAEATCTAAQTCTACLIEIVSAKGHSPSAPATCTNDQICTRCNQTLTAAQGHRYNSEIISPTCIKPGYTMYTCHCGDSYTDNPIDTIDHTPGKEATCTTAQSCKVCNVELIAALGHTPGKEPTCTTGQVCEICQTELKKALGHTPDAEATCTAPSSCTVCGTVLQSANAHKPGASATCTTAQTCTLCHIVLADALGHSYSTTTVAPTCEKEGYTTYLCHCGDQYTESIDMPEHTPGDWIHVKDATRTEDGLKEQKCTVCGKTVKSEVIPATGPSVGFYYKVDGQTCTITGMGSCTDKDLYIPSTIDGYKVTAIGDRAFDECNDLVSIHVPEGVTSIGVCAFYNCPALTTVILPNTVTSIGNGAFEACGRLTNFTIPESVKSIDRFAFHLCTGLTSIILPDGMTSISKYLFSDCSNLETVVIPGSIASIDMYAFDNCTGLKNIQYNGTMQQWKTVVKNSYWSRGVLATQVICSDGEVSLQ